MTGSKPAYGKERDVMTERNVISLSTRDQLMPSTDAERYRNSLFGRTARTPNQSCEFDFLHPTY